jgi:hypothetical protein
VTLDSQDSPQPGLRGSDHLPPYSILCASLRGPHPNGLFVLGSLGTAKVGLPQLYKAITSCLDLWLGWGLKQSCSFHWDLSNGVSHSIYTHGSRVDFRLFVVESQIANLTPDLSFCHNLCCKCPNGSCEPILDIYASITFQWYKELFNARCFDLCNRSLKVWESTGTPTPKGELTWECESSFSHSYWPAPLRPFCFGRKPKARVATITLAQWTIILFGKILCPKYTIEVITNSHFLRWIFILTSWSLLNNSSRWAKFCKSPLLCT